MALSPGTRLGPYEICAPLGAGGMGEVYQARDTRLDRTVAVKILPAEYAHNAQLKLRFEREARTISQLNHPHICTLFDVGHENGTDYLVMELIEGETLADRIGRGPLPVGDVLRYGVEIAEALDQAHRHGVVHRDLKPGNVMLTRSGAKLLDFGLARGGVIEVAVDGETMQMEKSLTQEGTIVGTFQYMSPEQLEGVGVDHRSDLFSLGAVLYEMATGRRAFHGKTRTSLIAAIVAAQPVPVSQVQPLAPPALEHVIERCLAKDPADRWQSARDVAEELRWIREKGSQTGVAAAVVPRRNARERLAWSIAVLACIAAIVLGAFVATRPAPKRVVTSINAPEGTRFSFDLTAAVISPDGNSIVFAATGSDGRTALWVRQLSSTTALRLAGTEGATFPFWSPDSRHIAFFADGKLKRVEAGGGPVDRIADAPSGRGGAWGRDDVIIFSPTVGDPLFRVSATGGEARPVTRFASHETSHRLPSFLPDGVRFVFYMQGPSGEEPNLYVGSVDGMQPKKLIAADAAALVTPSGELLYVRDGILRARRLDLDTLALDPQSATIAERVQTALGPGYMNVSVSDTGTLTYVAGGPAVVSRLVWLGRDGKESGALPTSGDFEDPRLSPDGKYLAYAMGTTTRMNLYLYDVARRVSSRFTFGAANEWAPVWSPDGQWIAFTSFVNSGGDIHVKRASGTEPERKLVGRRGRTIPSDWSRDGRILYHAMHQQTGWDIEIYSMREGRARPFLRTPFGEFSARFSPDGRWVVYASNESGSNEIYVRSADPSARSAKWQVSSGGGQMPSWSPDGREIYFISPDQKLMAAAVAEEGANLSIGIPGPILDARLRYFSGLTRNQYTTADGKTFVMNAAADRDTAPASITVVQNWRER